MHAATTTGAPQRPSVHTPEAQSSGEAHGSPSVAGGWHVGGAATNSRQRVPAQQASVSGPHAAPAATQLGTRPPHTFSTQVPLTHSREVTQNDPFGETGVQTLGPYGPSQ
jgi:hypothetical protein